MNKSIYRNIKEKRDRIMPKMIRIRKPIGFDRLRRAIDDIWTAPKGSEDRFEIEIEEDKKFWYLIFRNAIMKEKFQKKLKNISLCEAATLRTCRDMLEQIH